MVSPFFFQKLIFADLQPDSLPPIRLLAMWVSQSWKSCCSLIPHWSMLYRGGDISKLSSESLNLQGSHSLKCSAAVNSVKLLHLSAQDSALLAVMICACSPRLLLVWLLLSQMRQSRGFHMSSELEGIYLCSFMCVCVCVCMGVKICTGSAQKCIHPQ